jgi:hypothetical protein
MSLKKIITFSILAICFSLLCIVSNYQMKIMFNSIETLINNHDKYISVIKTNIYLLIFWGLFLIYWTYIKITLFNLIYNIELYVKNEIFNFIQSIPYEEFVKITSEKAFSNLAVITNIIKEIYNFFLIRFL